MDGFENGLETWTVVIDADTSLLRRELDAASRLGRRFSHSLIKAFEGIAIKGRSLGEVLRSLALDLSNIVLRAAFKPLEQGLGLMVSGLLSGGLGATSQAAQSLPVPFAKGGVLQSPFTFPLSRGRLGVAGEQGAEAIMPLARTRDGRLGVVAQGGGGISVVINVTTPDAESFQRGQTQIAAAIARAISIGQRNL